MRTWFVWERGDLILGDTVMLKPFATAIESLVWAYSSQEHKPGYGLSLVWPSWRNGMVRIPMGMRLWHMGGPSQCVIALEMLSDARHRLHCLPAYTAHVFLGDVSLSTYQLRVVVYSPHPDVDIQQDHCPTSQSSCAMGPGEFS